MAGHGTISVEILESVRVVVVPVGSGGLVGGMAAYLRWAAPHIRMVGVQSDRSNAMAASLAAGRRVHVPVPPTLADGLNGQIDDAGLGVGRDAIDDMVVISEEEMRSTVAWLAREHDMPRLDGPVAVVLTGGNIDTPLWEEVIAQYPSSL